MQDKTVVGKIDFEELQARRSVQSRKYLPISGEISHEEAEIQISGLSESKIELRVNMRLLLSLVS